MNLRSPYSPSWALIIPNKVTIWSATLRSSIMKSSEIFAWKAGWGFRRNGSSWHCWIFASTKNPRSFRNFCPWSNFLLIKIGIATFMKIQKISRPICRIIWENIHAVWQKSPIFNGSPSLWFPLGATAEPTPPNQEKPLFYLITERICGT